MPTRSHHQLAAPALLLGLLSAGLLWAAPGGADTPTPTGVQPSMSATLPATSAPTTVSPTPISASATPAFTAEPTGSTDPGVISVPAGHVDVARRGAAGWQVAGLVAAGGLLAGAGALTARRR